MGTRRPCPGSRLVIQNQWAFYPLFPGLVRAIMFVTHLPFGVAASFLNITLASVAMCLVYRMISHTASPFAGAMTIVVLSTFPSAVVFQLAYSEALTFLLVFDGPVVPYNPPVAGRTLGRCFCSP